MTWTVICPSGDPDNIETAVKSVLATHPGVSRERIVGVVGFGESCLPQALEGIRLVRQRSPFVYAQAVNDGISAVQDGAVILLNDDVTVTTPGTFDILEMSASKDSDEAILHPAVDGNTMGHEFMTRPPGPEGAREILEFPFICPFIPRRILDSVGMFDESFVGYGKEDYDFCVRTRLKGFRLGMVHETRVFHDVRKSMYRRRRDLQAMLKFNHRRLLEKWGINSP